jgi:hypothetical protein
LQDTRFYLHETVRLLKSLLSFGSLALVAVGCDVATNQTGGAWLASQQGIRPPTAIVLDSVPLRFKGWVLESGITSVVQVGTWKGNSASHMVWIPVDTSINVAQNVSWDSLGLLVSLDTGMAHPAMKMVRNFWVKSRTQDSLFLAGVYANVVGKLGLPLPDASDTISIGARDSIRIDGVPTGIRVKLDSLRKNSSASGLLVQMQPIVGDLEGIVQISSIALRAESGMVESTKSVDVYAVGSLNSVSLTRSFLKSAANDSSQPFLQGGPVHWSMRLSLDQQYLKDQLKARGLNGDLRSMVVLDAQLLLDADTASQDAVTQRVDLYSEVIGNLESNVTLTPKSIDATKSNAQAFDSLVVSVDTVTQGDSLSLKLTFKSTGGTVDSLFLKSDDTLQQPYSNGAWPMVFSLRRSGNQVNVQCKGLLAGLVREAPWDRNGNLRGGILLGRHLNLLARRPFSAMLNWPERSTDIILAASASDATHWWQLKPDLEPGHAKVRLTLLPVGGAQ